VKQTVGKTLSMEESVLDSTMMMIYVKMDASVRRNVREMLLSAQILIVGILLRSNSCTIPFLLVPILILNLTLTSL